MGREKKIEESMTPHFSLPPSFEKNINGTLIYSSPVNVSTGSFLPPSLSYNWGFLLKTTAWAPAT